MRCVVMWGSWTHYLCCVVVWGSWSQSRVARPQSVPRPKTCNAVTGRLLGSIILIDVAAALEGTQQYCGGPVDGQSSTE